MSNIHEYSVSELSNQLKQTIEEKYGYVRLRGEISGFKRHSSGHCYFSLKDEKSVMDAIIWRGNASKISFPLQDGLEVIGTGKVTTFAGRSKYQIMLDHVEPAGEGALMALLEALKKKLSSEGLFDERHKKKLPFLPQIITVITSPTGAVIRDILHRLKDRYFPHIYVFPVVVQGELSAKQVSYAINFLNNKCTQETPIKRPDLIILARGGGSIEDLWSFNEETVARSIFASKIPIISAIGHETDFTLADFVSDKRAPTPTAAAEMAVPVKQDLLQTLNSLKHRSDLYLKNTLQHKTQLLDNKSQKLDQNLSLYILQQDKKIAELSAQFRPYLIETTLHKKADTLKQLENKVTTAFHNYLHIQTLHLQKQEDKLKQACIDCDKALQTLLETKQENIKTNSKILETLSYEKILQRGYAVVYDTDNKVISDKKSIKTQTLQKIQFHDGYYKIK